MMMFSIAGESYGKLVTENLKIKKGRKSKWFYASGEKTEDAQDSWFLILFAVLKLTPCM